MLPPPLPTGSTKVEPSVAIKSMQAGPGKRRGKSAWKWKAALKLAPAASRCDPFAKIANNVVQGCDESVKAYRRHTRNRVFYDVQTTEESTSTHVETLGRVLS